MDFPQEAGDESCYDLHADLTPCSNGTKIHSNIKRVLFSVAKLLAYTYIHTTNKVNFSLCSG